MRAILTSGDDGMSNKEIAIALTGALSPQGLANALKALQTKGLVYRDIAPGKKISGAHASYRSTAASFEPAFVNNAAEFMLSKEAAMIHLPIATSPPVTANCLFPSAALISETKEPFRTLGDDADLGRRLRDVANRVTSAWLDYRMGSYGADSLRIVTEYEDALATYLRLFECKLQRWVPQTAREPPPRGPYSFVDPLDMVEHAHSIDWPLKKYHITEEELEQRHALFPHAGDELDRLSVKELRKLKAVVYNRRKKRIYEEYLKALVPPKTLLLLDFGLSSASLREHLGSRFVVVNSFGQEGGAGDAKIESEA